MARGRSIPIPISFEARIPLPQTIPRHDPRPSAQAFLEAFGRAVDTGTMDRARVIPVAKAWRALSVLSGSDASWGILGGVSRLLGISEAELQEPGPAMTRAPVEDMYVRLAGVGSWSVDRSIDRSSMGVV